MAGIENKGSIRKWLVVHGHFYQPPRENPWLDVIETQPSAQPFHDWNERIYSECYRPNGYSRLLDGHGMIDDIHNNYELMSFNFGPTLLSWLKRYHPVTFNRIVEGDRMGTLRCAGHGNALAQVYNHIIMPLASHRDKLTQIRWAKTAFKRCFGREAQGMWLSETAINMETAKCLIEEKIAFVVLAPSQAEAIRPLDGHSPWSSVTSHGIDTRRPYRLFATDTSGNKTGGYLDVFFFDEVLSKEISFNGLLKNAQTLGDRINNCYSPGADNNEVVVIATDGETFGHHKPFGDMCLAYFFKHIAPVLGIVPVNFSYYLANNPPYYELTLRNAFGEGTAWSCAHGVGRWARDCGCSTGGESSWNQAWRAPLRSALNNLQQRIDAAYLQLCNACDIDPWKLRDWHTDEHRAYGFAEWNAAVVQHFPDINVTDATMADLRRLLEAQRYMLFSFTSCGWFFSEISGIEPMQNLSFACRALQLGISGSHQQTVLETFLADLAKAPSNIGKDTGATLFTRHIMPYFYHNHMMAFIAAMEKMFGIIPGTTIEQFGYECMVKSVDSGKMNIDTAMTGVFQVTILHKRYNKMDHFLVMVDCTGRTEPNGWVVPSDPKIKVTATTIIAMKSDPAVQLFSLSTIFLSTREEVGAVYRKKIAEKSIRQFSAWFDDNEKDLSLLESCYHAVPEYFKGAISFVLQLQWDNVFRKQNLILKAGVCYAELPVIYEKIKQHGVVIDLTFSADRCEKSLTVELEQMKKQLTADQCENICLLMDIVDSYHLPVAKHRLEDIFHLALIGPITELYKVVTASEKRIKADGTKDLLIKILKFAQRMNFNTDHFPLQ